jgi:vitamin B12 transporter
LNVTVIIRSLALSLLTTSFATVANTAAQEVGDTATVLDSVVITATKLPTRRQYQIASVTVLDGRDLRQRGIRTLHDAMRSVPGMDVFETGSFGSATSIFVRGGESDYMKVLVDGVPINLPGGAIDYANLTLDNVERIEVVRGPTSVLYGSDAVSGVVQLFTTEGQGPTRADVGIRAGTHSSVVLDGAFAGGSRKASYSIGFSHSATDGIYDFNNEYDNTTVSGLLRIKPGKRSDGLLAIRYGNGEYQYPTDGSGRVVDRNSFQTEERLALALDVGHFFSNAIEGRLLLAWNDLRSGFDDQADGPADTVGFFGYVSDGRVRRKAADLRANFFPSSSTIVTVGLNLENQDEDTRSETLSEFGATLDSLAASRLNLGYYVQLQVEPVSRGAVNAGLRLDDNDAFGTFLTYRLGATYEFITGTRLRGSLGKGFKEPTFLENYGNSPFAIGNSELVPERSTSWEVGAEQRIWRGRLSVGATYFDQRFRDMIQYTFVTADPGDPNYLNVAAADASGLELTAHGVVTSGLTLEASYTYLITDVTDAGFDSDPEAAFVAGDRLLRRPTHHLGLNAQYGFLDRRARVDVSLNYIGDRDDRDFSVFPVARVTLPGYTRIDAAAEFVVVRRGSVPTFTVTGRVENLFGAEYHEVVGFPARGRVVVVGVRVGM